MEYTFTFRKRFVYLINIFVILSFIIGAYFIDQKAHPFIQGFYCDDESISRPSKNSTIPAPYGLIATAVLFVICFCLVEFMKIEKKAKRYYGWKCLASWATDVTYLLLLVVFGSGITLFITYITKYTVGRPAPHFLDVCKPDWSKFNCTDNMGRRNYIVGDEFCTTEDDAGLKQARLSFPSVHASFSSFAATFVILYIEYGVRSQKWGHMPKLFVQVAFACGALYIGLANVSDYLNHPTDVLGGFVIGMFVGMIVQRLLRQQFHTFESLGVSNLPEHEGL